jgi:ribosomal protein L37AE/L43A
MTATLELEWVAAFPCCNGCGAAMTRYTPTTNTWECTACRATRKGETVARERAHAEAERLATPVDEYVTVAGTPDNK